MKVTIYTTPDCVQCNQTKKVFDRKEIKYETVDLSTDSSAMEMVKSLGYSQAPVVIAGDQHWSGFRMARIEDVIVLIEAERAHQKANDEKSKWEHEFREKLAKDLEDKFLADPSHGTRFYNEVIKRCSSFIRGQKVEIYPNGEKE